MAASGEACHIFTINVNGSIVTGTGRSDQAAKEDALKQISKMVNQTPQTIGSTVISARFGAKNDISENVIGKLQEYCQARNWPFPIYTLEKMLGPSHMPCFSMKCSVLGFTAVGNGTSKKEAKHNAAKLVYNSVVGYSDMYRHNGSEAKRNLLAIRSLSHAESTENPEEIPLILEELPSSNTKSAIDSCENSDDQSLPPDFIVLDKQIDLKRISIKEHSDQVEEVSTSAKSKPIPMPSMEDFLCSQLQKLNSSAED